MQDRVMRFAFLTALLGFLASACGDSFEDGKGGSNQDGGGAGGTGSGGTTGSGGKSGAGGSAGAQGSGGSSGSSGSGGSGGCSPVCGFGLTCCDGRCVNTANDVNHCGQCKNQCPPE